jgi:hypothetical protein
VKSNKKITLLIISLKQQVIANIGVVNKKHVTIAENLLKNCYKLSQTESSIVFAEIKVLAKYLGSIGSLEDQLDSLYYYQLYDLLCSITYKLTKPVDYNLKNDNILKASDVYKSQGFWLADSSNTKELAYYLKPFFDLLPHEGKSFENCELKRSLIPGYSFNKAKVNSNQLHVEELPIEAKRHLDDYITKSDLIKDLSRGLGFNLKVCNVRVYRYFHSTIGQEIRPHRDGMPKNVFKLMAFNGDIALEHGAFEVLKDEPILRKDLRLLNLINRVAKKFNINAVFTNRYLFSSQQISKEVIASCVGRNPFMIINSNKKLHRALNPEVGLIRDTVEISFMPRLFDDSLVTVGGCQSGAPLNPFSFVS